MKNILNKKNLLIIISLVVVLLPLIELDYLIYPSLAAMNIPRITTVVKLIIIPLLVLLTFYLYDENKKKTIILTGIYAVVFGIYFILHHVNANELQYNMFLPTNFYYDIVDELLYFITIITPLVYIYVFNKINLKEDMIKKISIGLSSVIAIPIFISNIFVFGMSTYEGYTIDNMFSWFSLPFNETVNHPRLYATKFFFEEGNSIGILLFMLLPFLYYFFFKANNKKEKIYIGILTVIQSLAMIMLATRIATYGTILVPAAMLGIYIILLIIKTEKFNVVYTGFLIAVTLMSYLIIPYGVAVQNQALDAQNHGFIQANNSHLVEGNEVRQGGAELEKYSTEWRNFYVFMFEAYSYMIGVTPPVYYIEWYDYRHDPQFWVDLIFDYDLEERVSGRQLQQIFTNYKYDPLAIDDKVLGMGYSTYMNGSILLEQDFLQQFYTLGYVGFALTMAPWLLLLAFMGIKLILGFKKGSWNYLNIILMMSYCLGLIGAYMSGHTIDELITSLFIALCAGVLIKRLNDDYAK